MAGPQRGLDLQFLWGTFWKPIDDRALFSNEHVFNQPGLADLFAVVAEAPTVAAERCYEAALTALSRRIDCTAPRLFINGTAADIHHSALNQNYRRWRDCGEAPKHFERHFRKFSIRRPHIAPIKEDNMYRLLLTATAAAAILTTASLMPNRAAAIPLGGQADIPLALEEINPIEKAALCFYLDGWNGPGLYECGFRRRYGEGFVRREREERRERFEDHERRERFEERERRERERRERFERHDRY